MNIYDWADLSTDTSAISKLVRPKSLIKKEEEDMQQYFHEDLEEGKENYV